MNEKNWDSLVRAVNADIAGMTKARQVRAQVRNEIAHRTANPMEEQFIDADAFGRPTGQPTIFTVNGQKLKVWKLHRIGLRAADVQGADLYYEIEELKYVLIQYKSPSPGGRVGLDSDQLSTLKSVCPNSCPPSNRFSCGSWFAIQSTAAKVYFPACEAQNVFGRYKSRKTEAFINGLTKDQFHEQFRSCHIGARTEPVDMRAYQRNCLSQDRVFIRVQQVKP